ncbi:MAG TPA: hypothetical protein VGQ83_37420 [Polyangia bacterium]|jgi:hypothetical protein
MLGILVGMLYANAGEWLLHKYVLHRLGRRRGSFYAYHWHEHHRNVRLHGLVDPTYTRSVFGWHAQGKEALSLVGLGLAHLPLAPLAPLFTATVLYSLVDYYRKHKRAHVDPAWARARLPWHVDHHLGPNPEANFCITRPWFDHVMGTRELWVGTAAEAAAARAAA